MHGDCLSPSTRIYAHKTAKHFNFSSSFATLIHKSTRKHSLRPSSTLLGGQMRKVRLSTAAPAFCSNKLVSHRNATNDPLRGMLISEYIRHERMGIADCPLSKRANLTDFMRAYTPVVQDGRHAHGRHQMRQRHRGFAVKRKLPCESGMFAPSRQDRGPLHSACVRLPYRHSGFSLSTFRIVLGKLAVGYQRVGPFWDLSSSLAVTYDKSL